MIVLLTGGSACGKSFYAESLCQKLPEPRYYIAAMKPYGEEGEDRIKRHRAMRLGKGFETIERYTGLKGLELPQKGTVLLECICNLTANEMFDDEGNVTDPFDAVLEGVKALAAQSNDLIVITNDVGAEFPHYSPETEQYIRVMGKINCALAAMADTVLELTCGIPIPVKGDIPE